MHSKIHLCIVQPQGYIHSQGFLDQARYARYQFCRLGAHVTLGKNRLREDSINIIFGGHLGFDVGLKERYRCVFFNLEQLGNDGIALSDDYIQLLSSSAVIDYNRSNLDSYSRGRFDIPIVSFLFAPYLTCLSPINFKDRPIDLLFFGSLNDRRKDFISRIESSGVNVSLFDHPLYAEERDFYIRQSKAVINCHFYEASRFEQARVFHTISLGTPVISERRPNTNPPKDFEDVVTWITDEDLESFFREMFMTPNWQVEAANQIQRFTCRDNLDEWRIALDYCNSIVPIGRNLMQPWLPRLINLGSGKDYKLGWLNIDILERSKPDVVIDLCQEIQFPIKARTKGGGDFILEKESVDQIYANNVLEHVSDLPCMMTNILNLLREGGVLNAEVPYEKSRTAWQDPTHLRAMNINSWLYYTSWFWYLGWFHYRFEISYFEWLDESLRPCPEEQAAFMKVQLKKVSTTMQERAIARTMMADFGFNSNDEPLADFEVQ